MRTLALSGISAQVTLNGSGNGTAQVGPRTPGHIWYPQSVTISMLGGFPAVSGTNTPICSIYAGAGTNAGNLVDATYQVLGASSSMVQGQALYPGQSIFAVWLWGNPGVLATLNVFGSRQCP
jgi:hypothetical protein